MDLAGLDASILGPALMAGLLVLSTHVPLGQVVLARGIIFIDLAIAQIAGLGVLAAGWLGWPSEGPVVQVAAVAAALSAALVLHFTEARWPRAQEAVIGISFVLAATGGILVLAGNPHAGEYLQNLLVGQILWTSWSTLAVVAVLYAGLLLLWWRLGERAGGIAFYLVFAVAVTASVQIVGVYLVFASLIVPALATSRLAGQSRLLAGYLLGGAGYVLGILISAIADLPTGAVIVWALVVCGVPFAALLRRSVAFEPLRQTDDRAGR